MMGTLHTCHMCTCTLVMTDAHTKTTYAHVGRNRCCNIHMHNVYVHVAGGFTCVYITLYIQYEQCTHVIECLLAHVR